MVYDGYVKYAEAEIHRSAIMLNFRDSEKKKKLKKYLKKKIIKKKNARLAAILDFLL